MTESRGLSALQWQLIMSCWRQNLRPGLRAWWGPTVFKLGALLFWLARLRKTNGPNFTLAACAVCRSLAALCHYPRREASRRPPAAIENASRTPPIAEFTLLAVLTRRHRRRTYAGAGTNARQLTAVCPEVWSRQASDNRLVMCDRYYV